MVALFALATTGAASVFLLNSLSFVGVIWVLYRWQRKPAFKSAAARRRCLLPSLGYYEWQRTDQGKLGGPNNDFVVHARKNLLPVRDRLIFYKDGQEFLPGVQAMAAPGHTVGHHIFMITSEGKSFAFLGDLTHHQILLMEKPRMEFSYDTDPKQAAESRVKMLDMLAANKIAVMSYHYPWPGIGHVVKTGEGFHYIPQPMVMTL